jgi:hypothetical protein
MGSKGGGGSGSSGNSFGFSSGTSTYTPNPQAMAAFQQSLGMANNAVSRPYETYQGSMTAGFTPDQMSAMQGVRNTQGIAQPYINTATNLTGQAVDYSNPANFNQYSLNQYMNPYQQSVVDATMKQLAQTQAQADQQAQSRYGALQGTFGGSGAYLGRAEVARQQGLANAQTLAGLNAQNYQQAQNQYNQQQQQAIQTAQSAAYGLGQLGNMAQSSALTGINALLQSGGMQQQLAQQQLTGAYNQWLQSKAYPYQQAAFYSGIASGIGPSMGGTTTYSGINMGQQQQQQSGGGGGAAGGLQMLGSLLPAMFPSDERLKTDKQKIGKDENTGLDMYAYRYKGDPKSYPKVVGPMAQDVEEKYPGFVFDVGGRKAVADLGRFMPRDEKASGGSSSGASSSSPQSSSTQAAAPTSSASYYSPYGLSGPIQGSMQAQAEASLDPGTAAFIKGAFDPRTADQMARAKWVSPETETRTSPEDSFGYFSELTRSPEETRQVPRATRARGGAFGELPSQVNPNPLSGSAPIGTNFLNPKPSPGSLGDMNTDTKLMFGANPIDSPQGFATIAAIPSAGMASANAPADAAKWAKSVVPDKAPDVGIGKTAEGMAKAKAGAQEAVSNAKPGGGGGGGGGKGGGGEGLGKIAKGAKSAIDKVSGGSEKSIPSEDTPSTETSPATESPDSKSTDPNMPSSVEGGSPEGNIDVSSAESFAPTGGTEVPQMADPGMGGMADMGGGMGGMDWLKGLGGLFAARGGRIQKDGGGAAGGAGGFGTSASGDIAPSGLAEAAGVSTPDLLGIPSAGLGDLTLGFGNKPSDLAGFGNLKAGQEQRTGNDLVKGWMDEYRADYKGGPQLTPKEQGMPEMPDAEWYKTPLNVSDLSIGSNGTPNPGGITSYTPIATGMKANGGIGMFPTFSPPTNGSDYNDTSKMFKAPPVSKYKGEQPVHGYYTGLASQQVNPDTGLFNINYLAPYYGGFYKDGGRVGKQNGGSLSPEEQAAIDQRVNQIIRAESRGNPRAQNPRSTAGGLGQFINRTWLDWARKTNPSLNQVPSQQVLALKKNASPEGVKFQRDVLRNFTADNALRLKREGLPITPSNLYSVHFSGNTRIAGARPNTPMRAILDRQAQIANPSIARMNVAQFRNQMSKNMGDGSTVGQKSPLQSATTFGTQKVGTPALKEVQTFGTQSPKPSLSPLQPSTGKPVQLPSVEQPKTFAQKVSNELFPKANAAEAPKGSVLNQINPNDPSGALLPKKNEVIAPAVTEPNVPSARNTIMNRGVPAPSILDANPAVNAAGDSVMNKEGKLDFYPAYPSNATGTDVTRPMTMPGNVPPMQGFGQLPLAPMSNADVTAPEEAPTEPTGVVPPSETPQITPTPNTSAPKITPAASATSGQNFWGDWRDSPQNKSDLGDEIDKFAGDIQTANKPGSESTPMGKFQGEPGDIGSLFDMEGSLPDTSPADMSGFDLPDVGSLFAKGGAVRKGYLVGGTPKESEEEGFNPLAPIGEAVSSVGDTIGQGFDNLLNAGETPVIASDKDVVTNQDVPAQNNEGFGSLFGKNEEGESFFDRWAHNPMSQFLFSSGLATMASPYQSPWMAMGEGGLHGLQYMQAAQSANEVRAKERKAEEAERTDRKIFEKIIGVPGTQKTASAEDTGVPSLRTNAEIAPPEVTDETDITMSPEEKQKVAEEQKVSNEQVAPANRPSLPSQPDLDRLNEQHKRLSNGLGLIKSPTYRSAITAQLKALEYEINRQEKKAIPISPRDYPAYNIPKDSPGPWYYNPATGMPVQAGKPGTTVNMPPQEGEFQKYTGRKLADTVDLAYNEGAAAIEQKSNIERLEELSKDIPFGSQAGIINYLSSNFGVNLEGADKTKAFSAVIDQLAPKQRDPGSGAMSDRDLAGFKNSLPGLLSSKEGNQIIVDTLKGLYDYRIARGQIAERVIAGELTPTAGLKEMRTLQNPFSRYKEYQSQHKDEPSAQPKEQPKTGINSLSDEEIENRIKQMSGK